jgi:hypothetical protein
MLPTVITRSKLSDTSGTYSRAGLSGLTSTERPLALGSLSGCELGAFSLSMITLLRWVKAEMKSEFALKFAKEYVQLAF